MATKTVITTKQAVVQVEGGDAAHGALDVLNSMVAQGTGAIEKVKAYIASMKQALVDMREEYTSKLEDAARDLAEVQAAADGEAKRHKDELHSAMQSAARDMAGREKEYNAGLIQRDKEHAAELKKALEAGDSALRLLQSQHGETVAKIERDWSGRLDAEKANSGNLVAKHSSEVSSLRGELKQRDDEIERLKARIAILESRLDKAARELSA